MLSAERLARIIATPLTLGVYLGPEFPDGSYTPYGWLRYVEQEIITSLYSPGNEIIIVSVPFQVGKSTYFSHLLPTWYLGRFPNRTWLNISYNDERAKSWGRLTRNTLRRHGQELFGVQVDTESDSAGEWHFANYTGGMISSGIRSTVNGVTAHVIVIDDHLKSMEEANSPQVKSRNMDEFDSVIMGRFQSNPIAPTKCLIINTRMVEDDIGGTLLERASQPGYEGFPVRLINIKAIAEPDPHELAEMSDEELAEWRDVLGRRYGEALESRHTSEFYHLRRKSLPPSMWSAMYQGLPTYSAGGMFPEEHWRFWATHPVDDPLVVQLPELTKRVRVWDVASSEGSGDWTVGTLWGRDRIGRTFLLDRARFRHGPGRTHDLIVETAHADGFEVPILIEQERSGAGATVVEGFQRALPGFVVEGAKAEASKESRATPYSTAQNKAMVHLPFGAPWIREWTAEHAQMDGKGKRPKHDDQIDTGAYAHRYLLSAGESAILDIQGIDQIEGLSDTERAEAKMLLDALGMMG